MHCLIQNHYYCLSFFCFILFIVIIIFRQKYFIRFIFDCSHLITVLYKSKTIPGISKISLQKKVMLKILAYKIFVIPLNVPQTPILTELWDFRLAYTYLYKWFFEVILDNVKPKSFPLNREILPFWVHQF